MAQPRRLTIDSIAAGGDGVGRTDGLVVFVPRTAPGDEIDVSILTKKKHFARGVVQDIIIPSPDRTEPSCLHYTRNRCGGCQLQHMTYESQLAAKQRMIADAMRRIGKRDVEIPAIHASAAEWRYRTKLTLALRRRGNTWIAGLHPYDAPGNVFHLEDCPITDERVVAAWREVVAASDCFPDVHELRGSIRWTEAGPTFVLMGAHEWTPYAQTAFFDATPSLSALYWEPVDRPRVLLADRRSASTPAASFAQINPRVATQLRTHVEQRVISYAPSTVVDSYSGNGDLAVTLASQGITVFAIELDTDAAQWASTRLATPSRSIQGRVEDKLGAYLPADVLVFNPPRGGLHDDIPSIIQQHPSPRAILYISCDPATLARDIARLPSYQVHTVTAFDMFPQTSHVETVCELIPHKSAV